jgi:hypothetical protein
LQRLDVRLEQLGSPFGLLQSGSTSTFNGEGFEINSPVMDQPQLIGNRSHDNFGEGFDNTPQTETTVNTSNTTVMWVSGDSFNLSWKAGQAVRINGFNYLISAVNGAQTTMTLTTSAGTQCRVGLIGVGYSRAMIIGNYAYHTAAATPAILVAQGLPT